MQTCLVRFNQSLGYDQRNYPKLEQSILLQNCSSFSALHLCYSYTCQLFPRYRREIFILGVLRFLKTTRSFPKIHDEVRSLPKNPESSENVRSLSPSINANSLPVLFTSKVRDRKEGIVIQSLYTWFSFLTWVLDDIFLEIASSKTATTHVFQSGVRNWPAGVSRREIEVFNLQA